MTDTDNTEQDATLQNTPKDIATILHTLDALLEEERAALLGGELAKIDDLMRRKEALIDALSDADGQSDADLAALQSKLGRNQVLFDHALEGIRNVANRLGALRQLRKSLDTYDEQGRKSTITTPNQSLLEKRA